MEKINTFIIWEEFTDNFKKCVMLISDLKVLINNLVKKDLDRKSVV